MRDQPKEPGRARRWVALGAGLVVVSAAAGEAEASPQDVIGMGARRSGLGQVGAAIAEGHEAVHANPAGIVSATQPTLALGVLAAKAMPTATGVTLPTYDSMFATTLALAVPVPLPDELPKVALGLSAITPTDLVVRARVLQPEVPQFLLPDRLQSIGFVAGLGVEVFEGLSLGAGFAALATLKGRVDVALDASGRIGTVVEDTLVARYAPIVGARYDAGQGTRVGATFRGELSAPFDVVIHAEDLGSLRLPPIHIAGTAQYDPAQLELEVAHRLDTLLVAIGAVYRGWSSYPGALEPTVRCPLERPNCGSLSPPKPSFSDTLAPRVGAELSIPTRPGVTLAARTGYGFDPTPAPRQTTGSRVFDEARSSFALGTGVALSDPLPPVAIDVFGQFWVLHGRRHEVAPAFEEVVAGPPVVETGGTGLAWGMSVAVGF